MFGFFILWCKVCAHDGLHLISELQVSSLVDKHMCWCSFFAHFVFEYALIFLFSFYISQIANTYSNWETELNDIIGSWENFFFRTHFSEHALKFKMLFFFRNKIFILTQYRGAIIWLANSFTLFLFVMSQIGHLNFCGFDATFGCLFSEFTYNVFFEGLDF